MNQPLVSIAISSYNHDRYITDSIVSVSTQTYTNIELLVIDDGSKDNSVDVIENLRKTNNFKFISRTNQGLSNSLNQALGMAEGKYFVPFGSDDIMMPDRIDKQTTYMENHHHVALCGGNMLKIDQSGAVLNRQRRGTSGQQDFHDVLLNRGSGITAPTMFFRTEVLKDVGGFNPSIALEDLYIKLKITKAGHKIGVMPDILSYYRVHESNTYKDLNYMLANVLKTYDEFKDDPYYEQAKYTFLNGMLLRAAKSDTFLARKILKMIPFKYYNKKTIRALPKLLITTKNS